ncbi:MAG: pseudouridine synthase [Syntrophomonas sp.]|uniref:pseudouridine synthase n=1 Tax=Syntrophomonas sp. TaxID=2053627 RepID=UPI00262C45AA|nr:pseudouridine synthase [Syntrophomonas sp.]MDD2510663.1 pseudouridine synthase [Syntrophomonas sp.]MDD3879608.1 pseudouridine synthase [Syntrophomonas sp.]MDD4627454.1 pseudouridine synthase [Syntrophomonas sp.]
MRLAKYLADSGISSRRQAEKLIAQGKVKVNGQTIYELAFTLNPGDRVEYEGKIVESADRVYLLLNKPRGYICTLFDPQGRPRVIDLLNGINTRVFPVGRLDFDTEGLLLLSNDGEFSNLMTHPRYLIPKKYEAWVQGLLNPDTIRKLEKGVALEDGITAPSRAKLLSSEKGQSLLELEIHEGKKRQIKRMCLAVGHRVISLKRTALAFLTLEGVARGQFRFLTSAEVEGLIMLARQSGK